MSRVVTIIIFRMEPAPFAMESAPFSMEPALAAPVRNGVKDTNGHGFSEFLGSQSKVSATLMVVLRHACISTSVNKEQECIKLWFCFFCVSKISYFVPLTEQFKHST